MDRMVGWGEGLKPFEGACSEFESGFAGRVIDDSDVLHINAVVEACTQSLGTGFLGRKALGVCRDMGSRFTARFGLFALRICKAPRNESLSVPCEGRFNPPDVDQVISNAQNHDAYIILAF